MCKNDRHNHEANDRTRSDDAFDAANKFFDAIFQDDTLEKSVERDHSDGAFRGKKPFRL